jgi:RNA polymerase sigma-70 factor (ECF subfamily)
MIKSLQRPESDNAWADLRATVHSFVARRVRDAHAAEDIAQDVMLKLRQNLSALPAGERVAHWAFRVARNAVIDHYRAAAARAAPIEDAAAVADHEPERNAIEELSRCLDQMIPHLPEPYREALRLSDLEERSQQEVADRMGIKLSAAKSRVQRARAKLHALLLDCCEFERDSHGAVLDYHSKSRSNCFCGDGEASGRCC